MSLAELRECVVRFKARKRDKLRDLVGYLSSIYGNDVRVERLASAVEDALNNVRDYDTLMEYARIVREACREYPSFYRLLPTPRDVVTFTRFKLRGVA